MAWRILEIESDGELLAKSGQLIYRSVEKQRQVPLSDCLAVILMTSGLQISVAGLRACAEANVPLMVVDWQGRPQSITLPLGAQSLQARVLAMQSRVEPALHAQLWQKLMFSKLQGQADNLDLRQRSRAAERLRQWTGELTAGDLENLEARAGRLYWLGLARPRFQRHDRTLSFNRMLNFGYAITRGILARYLLAVGLQPALGLHHHNQYDGLALANDLVEPLRPAIDRAVLGQQVKTPEWDSEARVGLLRRLTQSWTVGGRRTSFGQALLAYCASLKAAYEGGDPTLLGIPGGPR